MNVLAMDEKIKHLEQLQQTNIAAQKKEMKSIFYITI
jgi:hypothetical protein